MKLTRLNEHVVEVNHCLMYETLHKNRYQKYRIYSVLYARVSGFDSVSRSRPSSLTSFTVIWSVQIKSSCNTSALWSSNFNKAFRKFSSHRSVSNTKTTRLMLHKEIVAICSQNLRKGVYTLHVEYMTFNGNRYRYHCGFMMNFF
jgi:hypothetical protein